MYQLFCFAGKQISGNAQKLAVNELEQNLIDLNQTGLLNEARFEKMSKKNIVIQEEQQYGYGY